MSGSAELELELLTRNSSKYLPAAMPDCLDNSLCVFSLCLNLLCDLQFEADKYILDFSTSYSREVDS
jgi:hypothetical protein